MRPLAKIRDELHDRVGDGLNKALEEANQPLKGVMTHNEPSRPPAKQIPSSVETKFIGEMTRGLGLSRLMRLFLGGRHLLPLAIKLSARRDMGMAKALHALTRMTISPNVARGGVKTNIIAGQVPPEVGQAPLDIDIHTLPGPG